MKPDSDDTHALDLEQQRIDMDASQALRQGNYQEAMNAVACSSGDLHTMALLAVARELRRLYDALPVMYPGMSW